MPRGEDNTKLPLSDYFARWVDGGGFAREVWKRNKRQAEQPHNRHFVSVDQEEIHHHHPLHRQLANLQPSSTSLPPSHTVQPPPLLPQVDLLIHALFKVEPRRDEYFIRGRPEIARGPRVGEYCEKINYHKSKPIWPHQEP